ncbi:Abi-alpha family protein [Gemmatimonadota bacterium]
MEGEKNKSLDILGIKPIADAGKIVTEGMVKEASYFLRKICGPAADEFGLWFKDKIRIWRNTNNVIMTLKAKEKLKKYSNLENKKANPRITAAIFDYGSWIDNEPVQGMWAGLLASSCTEDGKDESNLLFINLLRQLTSLQAMLFKHSCEKSRKQYSSDEKHLYAGSYACSEEKIQEVSNCMDSTRLDRELNHLKFLGLITYGPVFQSEKIEFTPTVLGLQLYVRCQGSPGDPEEFFGIKT